MPRKGMFNIGLSEILVIVLVSILVLDKDQMPAFMNLIKTIYSYCIIAKSKIRKLLRDAGIEDLCKEYNVEKINYIVGKDGKFYPSYDLDCTPKNNNSEDSVSK